VNRAYAWAVFALALTFIAIGVALLAVTAAAGGGMTGYVLGALFLALGVARLTLQRRAGR
jgi:TRAP-type mannitol/chloroaromatic compound transport system permease large subunit